MSYPDDWEVHSETNDEVRLVTYNPTYILVDMTKSKSQASPLDDVAMEALEWSAQTALAKLGLDAPVITSGHWTHGVQGIFAEAEIEAEVKSQTFTFIHFRSPNDDDQAWLCMIVSFPLSDESKELIGQMLASTSLADEPVRLASQPPANWLQWTSPDGEWTTWYPADWQISDESETSVSFGAPLPWTLVSLFNMDGVTAPQFSRNGIENLETEILRIADGKQVVSLTDSGYWTDGVQGIFAEKEIETDSFSHTVTYVQFLNRNGGTLICAIGSLEPLDEDSRALIGQMLANTSLAVDPALRTIALSENCEEQNDIRICLTRAELTTKETRLYFTVENNTSNQNLLASEADVALVQSIARFESIDNSFPGYPDLPDPILPGVTAQTVVTFDAVDPHSTTQVVWNGVHTDEDSVAFDAFQWEFDFADDPLIP